MIKNIVCPAGQPLPDVQPGEEITLSGTLLTARDAAHANLFEFWQKKQDFPVNLCGAAIYYCGPTPAPPGVVIGACGPTTSGRMDPYTDMMLAAGVRLFIGKGPRSPHTMEAIHRAGGLYLATYGGAGAYLAQFITAAELLAFEELGTEAIFALTVKDFPAIVMGQGAIYHSSFGSL